MSTTFKMVKNELPDKPYTCNRFRNMISKSCRLHIRGNPFPVLEFLSTCNPIEHFVSVSYSAVFTSLEFLYYWKVFYF